MAAAVPERPLLPESRWVDLDGPVHHLDFGGPADGPLLGWLAAHPEVTDVAARARPSVRFRR